MITILDKLFDMKLNLDGLMLDMTRSVSELKYWCIPVGALPFADMCVDGVHYCIVPKEGDKTLENSPVYRISPMDTVEGTVLWTAKNFQEFISITVMLKDAWKLPILVHSFGKDENAFTGYLNDIMLEFRRNSIKERMSIRKEVKMLVKAFNPIVTPDLYAHIIGSFRNKNNHADIGFTGEFSELMKELSPGHYAWGDRT